MQRSARLREIVIFAVCASWLGCSKSEVTGPPEGCTFSTPYGCWSCEGSPFGRDYKIGCRKENDCVVFCGAIPSGFHECRYWETERPCTNEPLKRGTFEVCEIVGYVLVGGEVGEPDSYLPMVYCPYCSVMAFTAKKLQKAPDGDCYFIACTPEDVSRDPVSPESCPNLSRFGDAGVPDVTLPWDAGAPPQDVSGAVTPDAGR